uniref:Uncharacterized protein n=1 Tax=Brassica campestris TaxID=3711 RepID=M4F6G5_BRACM
MNSWALTSIPFSRTNSFSGFHCFAGIQIGSLKSLWTYTTDLRFFLNKQPLFSRIRFFPEQRLAEADAPYRVWSLVFGSPELVEFGG